MGEAESTTRVSPVRGAVQALPMSPAFLVNRAKLVQTAVRAGQSAGIVLVCAPKGFGKTALLLQYVQEVREDPARGRAELIDAEEALLEELMLQLDFAEERLGAAVAPLIAIDSLPPFAGNEARELVGRLRALRERGFELAVACTPAAGEVVRLLGDSAKVTAQQLRVQPREYPEWARVFSIAPALDLYALTQGIPVLVASLAQLTERPAGQTAPLDLAAADLYRSALLELRRGDAALYRIACLLVLMGAGSLADLEAVGVAADARQRHRLFHEYPMFGFDPATQRFACVSSDGAAHERLCEDIVGADAGIAVRAARAHLKAGRIDEAVAFAGRYLTAADRLELIRHAPMAVALAGYAAFTGEAVAERERDAPVTDAPALLAVYASALTVGDYRLARSVAADLGRRLEEAAGEVRAEDWRCAQALARTADGCPGIALPDLPCAGEVHREQGQAALLGLHGRVRTALIERGAEGVALGERELLGEVERRAMIDIPALMVRCDGLLLEVLEGHIDRTDERDAELTATVAELQTRKLVPALCYVRCVLALRRLVVGEAPVDERAFVDAGTEAIRASDLAMQLLSMVLEGWQNLVVGQSANARFRAQQALRLVGGERPLIAAWASLLERTAHLVSASRLSIREEAELVDLGCEDPSVEEAWGTALTLSAARDDAELSAWYSLHKETLLDAAFRLPARLAMSVLGARADSLRRVMPSYIARRYRISDEEGAPASVPELVGTFVGLRDVEVGQLTFKLLGGFSVERNGHVLTDSLWHRKKAGIVAARLVLARGAFVDRRTITEELWPAYDYARSRRCLYTTLSTLRRAMGQGEAGPQYLLKQGDGIAVNPEYVTSDVARFEMLAREVLLSHAGLSVPELIERCLKVEEVYTGPLYVPDQGSPAFFMRMRGVLRGKFSDCMVRGIEAALDEEDYDAAMWMVEAVLREDPLREDVVRAAMRVYDRTGRRREVVELYGAHANRLEEEARGMPEPETRRLYESIIGKYRSRGILKA